MKKLLLVLLVLVSLPACAEIWFIPVPKADAASIAASLDIYKPNSPYTLRYTQPIICPITTVTYALIPVEPIASPTLTIEQWNSRLATMPAEFIMAPLR